MMRCNHLHDYFAEKFPELVQTIFEVTIAFDNSDATLNWPNFMEGYLNSKLSYDHVRQSGLNKLWCKQIWKEIIPPYPCPLFFGDMLTTNFQLMNNRSKRVGIIASICFCMKEVETSKNLE